MSRNIVVISEFSPIMESIVPGKGFFSYGPVKLTEDLERFIQSEAEKFDHVIYFFEEV